MAAPNLQSNDRKVELIQRVCRGEHEAFYELVRPHERAIYFAAMGVLNNPADAEEVSPPGQPWPVGALPVIPFSGAPPMESLANQQNPWGGSRLLGPHAPARETVLKAFRALPFYARAGRLPHSDKFR